jgi:hypothetical protein
MESHVASSKIQLLKAMEFGGSEVAPYITARSQIMTHNSGASQYGSGSAGPHACRFELNASVGAMLDLSSLVVGGRVHNLDVGTPAGISVMVSMGSKGRPVWSRPAACRPARG